MTIAPEVSTRARHSTDGEGISAADLLARFADAGFDRPTRSGRRAPDDGHETIAAPHGDDTVVTRDVPAGLAGDVPSAGLIRGRTSETGAFGRNPRAIAATMGATLVGATAVMGVVTALDSPDEAAADLQTRPVDLAGAEQATMKLQSVPSAASKLGGASAGTPAAFSQADAAKIASNNLAAAKKAADAKAAADQAAAAPKAQASDGGDDAAPASSSFGSLGMKALEMAKSKLGKPYVWGADGPNAFDCSGLMKWAFEQVGKDLPRSSSAQSQVGTPVSKSDLQPGDVVFFYSPVSHVGIYAGNGKILHASEPGEPVKYSEMDHMPFHNAIRL